MTLSDTQMRSEVMRCMKDFKYFITTYGHLMGKDVNGTQTGKIPFKMFDYQEESMDLIDQNQATIFLKARQLGLSWTIAGYSLWTAMFHKFQRVLIISINDSEASVFLEKVKFIFDNLPEWMKVPVYKRNESVLWFGSRASYESDEVHGVNSKIESIPTSKNAGSSRSINLLIIDEAAKVEFAYLIWKSAQPALSAVNGKAVLCSTMTTEATGEFFEEIWFDSKAGKNSFARLFIPYFRFPGRTKKWLQDQLAQMPASQRAIAKQEHPETEEDAFQAMGGKYFDVDALVQLHKPNLREPKMKGFLVSLERSVEFRPSSEGTVWIYEEPEPLEDYVVGGDPAEGVEQDNTALIVVRRRDYRVVAKFKSNTTDPEAAAHIAYKLGTYYNHALMGVENNNTHGGMVNIVLKDLYYNLYYHQIVDRDEGKPTKRWGWHTDGQNRTWILDYLDALIKRGVVQLNDKELYDEILEFVVDPKTGRGDHKKGKHDDQLIALAIACWLVRENPWFDRKKALQDQASKPKSKMRGGY